MDEMPFKNRDEIKLIVNSLATKEDMKVLLKSLHITYGDDFSELLTVKVFFESIRRELALMLGILYDHNTIGKKSFEIKIDISETDLLEIKRLLPLYEEVQLSIFLMDPNLQDDYYIILKIMQMTFDGVKQIEKKKIREYMSKEENIKEFIKESEKREQEMLRHIAEKDD